MKKSVKRITTLFLITVIIVSTAVASSAAEVNNELAKLKLYLKEKIIQPQTAQETVIFEKTSLVYGEIEAFIPEADMSDAESLADLVLVLLADGQDPHAYNGTDCIAALKAFQLENGSFSDSAAATVKSFIVLSGLDEEFEKSAAADYILALQQQSGEFNYSGNIMRDTWMCVAALSGYVSSSSGVRAAVSSAASYVKYAQQGGKFSEDTASCVAYAILIVTDAADVAESEEYGKLMTSLLRFQNDDGTFRAKEDDGKIIDRQSTMLALSALEAIRYGASEYKALSNNGGFNKGLDIEGLIPLLKIFGVIAALSAVMWIIVFIVKKPKTVTLDEFKEDSLKNVPVATSEELDISRPLDISEPTDNANNKDKDGGAE